jgi:hypothetical protein
VKNQYVGDQNDFAKYQLLRLCATIFEEILVAWMLTADDGLGDGAKIGYLQEPAWREADPELFDGLAGILRKEERTVAAVEASGLLPRVSFFPELLPLDSKERQQYFEAIASEAGSDSLVFFDPDNGLDVASRPRHRPGAEKYIYLDELARVGETGASLLVYQHFPRVQRAPYVETTLARLEAGLGAGYATFAAHTSHVAFLFAVTEPHAARLCPVLAEVCEDSPLLTFLG